MHHLCFEQQRKLVLPSTQVSQQRHVNLTPSSQVSNREQRSLFSAQVCRRKRWRVLSSRTGSRSALQITEKKEWIFVSIFSRWMQFWVSHETWINSGFEHSSKICAAWLLGSNHPGFGFRVHSLQVPD